MTTDYKREWERTRRRKRPATLMRSTAPSPAPSCGSKSSASRGPRVDAAGALNGSSSTT
jgi:hypothetical protein